MKSQIKRFLPRTLHHLYNRLVSRRRIEETVGSWFDVDWKYKADKADPATWVEMYDRSWENFTKQDLAIADIIRIRNLIPAGSSVLDCGCGDGYLLENLATRCHSRYGVDISRLALYRGRKRLGAAVRLVQSFAEHLPFKDDAFDVVVSTHTLEHVKDFEAAVAEIRRVARKLMLILIPCQKYLPYTADYHLPFFPNEKKLLDRVGINYAVCERYRTGDESTSYKGDVLLLIAELR